MYGGVVTDTTAPVTFYTPGLLQLLEPVSVSPALDLANAFDPTSLARKLLALISNPPSLNSLNLVIRLMFCLKLPNDDWDLPKFLHLYSDLSQEDMDIDLDSASRRLSRPIAEDVSVWGRPQDHTLPYFGQYIARLAPAVNAQLLEPVRSGTTRTFDASGVRARWNAPTSKRNTNGDPPCMSASPIPPPSPIRPRSTDIFGR